MKSKKLNLNDLKINSFITSLDKQEENTLKGGTTPECAIAASVASIATTSLIVGVTVSLIITTVPPPTKGENEIGAQSMCCSYLQECVNSYDPGCI
jgi:natural product precursor